MGLLGALLIGIFVGCMCYGVYLMFVFGIEWFKDLFR